jgi:protein-histidine pros-kinase
MPARRWQAPIDSRSFSSADRQSTGQVATTRFAVEAKTIWRTFMKLLVKFNLIFVLVVALGIFVAATISRNLLRSNAQQEVVENAKLLIEGALAVRGYTSGQITKLLAPHMEAEFLPQTVPSYSATEVLRTLAAKYPAYAYKEATLNPTNPRDRAEGWEADVVSEFRKNADLKEFIGQRETPAGISLYVARPLRISNPACLLCHSSVATAPKTLVDRYGPANGFGWNLNEVVGAQIISVPMAVPLARAQESFTVFIGSLIGVFAAVGVVLNLMIWLVVVRPVTRLSRLADRVSQGDLEAPEFAKASRDEIGVLTESFARMRTSVVQAMKMLEA